MNRKGSDLLDVFRSSPRRPSGGGGRGSGGGTGSGDGGPVVTLGRRHVFLVGAGAVLIVVFAFVAGLGVGRGHRKGAAGDPPALAGVRATSWRLPGAALPRIGTGAEDVLQRVKAAFEAQWPQLVGHYKIDDVPAVAGKASRFRMTVLGFPTREEAEKWQAYLLGWFVAGYVPFEHARPEPDR